MNAAILAAIMAAQRNMIRSSKRSRQNKNSHSAENFAERLLLQKGDPIAMKIAENETIITTVIRADYHFEDSAEWTGTVCDQEIACKTVEGCIQKILEVSKAKEFQLIPHSLSDSFVSGYLLVLKVDK